MRTRPKFLGTAAIRALGVALQLRRVRSGPRPLPLKVAILHQKRPHPRPSLVLFTDRNKGRKPAGPALQARRSASSRPGDPTPTQPRLGRPPGSTLTLPPAPGPELRPQPQPDALPPRFPVLAPGTRPKFQLRLGRGRG